MYSAVQPHLLLGPRLLLLRPLVDGLVEGAGLEGEEKAELAARSVPAPRVEEIPQTYNVRVAQPADSI